MELTFGQIVTLFVTHLLNIVIAAAVTNLVYNAAKFVKPAIARINAWLDDNNLDFAKSVIISAILAAEQKFESDEGQAKKKYVLDVVDAALKARGIDLPVEQIEASIEAAIKLGLHKADEIDLDEAFGRVKPPMGFDHDVRSVGSVGADDFEDEEVDEQ